MKITYMSTRYRKLMLKIAIYFLLQSYASLLAPFLLVFEYFELENSTWILRIEFGSF
jgi:hypothetical protein